MSTLNVQNINGVGDLSLDTLTSNTLTSNSIILDGTTLTATSGSSNTIVTGTAGTNGQFAQWNSNGNVIGADINTLSQATWETGTDTTEALVSPAKVAAAISSLVDAGSLLSVQVFTSSGTWTKPSGVNNVLVFVTGAGGGYNSGNSISGCGATAIKKIDVSSISTATITVGGVGNQSSGGSSVWSDGTNTVTGGGGIYNGGGGTATGGDINLSGGRSYYGNSFWGGYSYGTGGYGAIGQGIAGVVFVLEFT